MGCFIKGFHGQINLETIHPTSLSLENSHSITTYQMLRSFVLKELVKISPGFLSPLLPSYYLLAGICFGNCCRGSGEPSEVFEKTNVSSCFGKIFESNVQPGSKFGEEGA